MRSTHGASSLASWPFLRELISRANVWLFDFDPTVMSRNWLARRSCDVFAARNTDRPMSPIRSILRINDGTAELQTAFLLFCILPSLSSDLSLKSDVWPESSMSLCKNDAGPFVVVRDFLRVFALGAILSERLETLLGLDFPPPPHRMFMSTFYLRYLK